MRMNILGRACIDKANQTQSTQQTWLASANCACTIPVVCNSMACHGVYVLNLSIILCNNFSCGRVVKSFSTNQIALSFPIAEWFGNRKFAAGSSYVLNCVHVYIHTHVQFKSLAVLFIVKRGLTSGLSYGSL